MKHSNLTNPLLDESFHLPLFHKLKPEHLKPAIEITLKESEQILKQVENSKSLNWNDLIEPLEHIEFKLQKTWGVVSHLFNVLNSEPIRQAYEELLPQIVDFQIKMTQSQTLYEKYKKIEQTSPLWDDLNTVQKRIIKHNILSAELSGTALDEEKKKQFLQISQELSQASTNFTNNALDHIKNFSLIITNKHDIEGLPQSALELASQAYNKSKQEHEPPSTPQNGPWKITLDYPSYIPFMKYAKNRELRKYLELNFIKIASYGTYDNTQNIIKILQLRKQKAALLNYKTYAEVSLATKMAKKPDAVYKLLEDLYKASYTKAQEEFKELEEFVKSQGFTDKLEQWDIPYWAEKLKTHKFDYTDEELKQYFPLSQVLKGLFSLCETLFNIKIIKSNSNSIPKWHNDVEFFEVYDNNNLKVPIAYFYLDPYSRPENKRSGAWMDSCIPKCKINHKLHLPVAYIVCNFTPPFNSGESLLRFQEVLTLFHEFGHALQHMLTQMDNIFVSGTAGIEWDAVEIASQFMENWVYHKDTLKTLTKHIISGQTISNELFEKILKSKNYRAANMMLRQIRFGLVDIEIHHNYNPNSSDTTPFDIDTKIANKILVNPILKEDRTLCNFHHIFANGYAAGYYSYKWAEVLSADAFKAFKEVDINNKANLSKIGQRFKNTILALGGGDDPMNIYLKFRGKPPTIDALLEQSGLK